MPDRTRYLKRGVVPTAVGVTVALIALRLLDVPLLNWWCVPIPAVAVAFAYATAWVDHLEAQARAIKERDDA